MYGIFFACNIVTNYVGGERLSADRAVRPYIKQFNPDRVLNSVRVTEGVYVGAYCNTPLHSVKSRWVFCLFKNPT